MVDHVPPDQRLERIEEEPRLGVPEMHTPIAREHREPADGYEPTPIALIFVFFALLGWGGWYLAMYGGGFRGDILESPTPLAPRGVAVSAETAATESLPLGRRTYQAVCQACHQIHGQGVAPAFPPLAQSEYVLGSPEILARIILHGLQGPITVRGQPYNLVMPGWGTQLGDAEIAAVLTYIRESFGNDASPVSEELVAGVRSESERTTPWTETELAEVRARLDSAPPFPGDGNEHGQRQGAEKTESAAKETR